MQASKPLHRFVLEVYNTVNTFNEEQRKTAWPSHCGLNATASILTGQYTCTSVIQHPDASSGRLVCTSNQGVHSHLQADMSTWMNLERVADTFLVCVPYFKLKLFAPDGDQQCETLTAEAAACQYRRVEGSWHLEGSPKVFIRFAEEAHPMLLSDACFSAELETCISNFDAFRSSGRLVLGEKHGVDLDGLRLRTRVLSVQMSKVALCISEAQKPWRRHWDGNKIWRLVHEDWGRILKASVANKMAQVLCKKGQRPDKAFRDDMIAFFALLWREYIKQLETVTPGDTQVLLCQAC